MKNTIVNIFLTIVTVLGIPGGILYVIYPQSKTHGTIVWTVIVFVAITMALLQAPISTSTKIPKWVRKFRFYFSNTKTISTIFIWQLSILIIGRILFPFLISPSILSISYGISIIAVFLLITSEKIPNNDAKKILYRIPGGKIYLLYKNKLKFIPDPITFNLLGFKWADPIDISIQTFNTYEIDIPFASAQEVAFKKKSNIIYAVDNGILRAIPDLHTLARIQEAGNNNQITDTNNIDGYTIGEPYITANW